MNYEKKLTTFVEEVKIKIILRKINLILRAKFTFTSINKNKILIYDIYVASNFIDIFKKINYEKLNTRLEVINCRLFLKTLITKIRNKNLTIWQCYIVEYIKLVDPIYIITFTNVDIFFWTLKTYFPNKIFLIFQGSSVNGHTPNPFSILEQRYNKKFNIDYVFTWGKNLWKKYNKYLSCELFDSGSILNNSILNTRIKKKRSRDVIFISQYKESNAFLRTNENKIVSAKKSFHLQRMYLLKIIYEFCKSNKLNLKIFPRAYDTQGFLKEKNYYSNMFLDFKLRVIKRKYKNEIYKILSEYNNFITIDSSSGYEALGRGKRVCFLNIKYSFSKFLGSENHRYGWPEKLQKNYAFWSCSHKKREVERALQFSFFLPKKKWKRVKKKFIDPVITFDPKNKKLIEKLKSIGLKL
jgi:surface carbohydrate biosynthesis protein